MQVDFRVPTEEVTYRGGSFSVRGLSFDDIQLLVTEGNREAMEKAFQQFQSLPMDDADDAQFVGALSSLVTQLPALAAQVIAIAADALDKKDAVRKLPMTVQLDALLKIGRLTFDGEDAVKNFVRGLTTLMTGVSSSLPAALQAAKETGLKV